MPIQISPIQLPPSADTTLLAHFGREITGIDPGNLSGDALAEVQELLYAVSSLQSTPAPHTTLLTAASSTKFSSSATATSRLRNSMHLFAYVIMHSTVRYASMTMSPSPSTPPPTSMATATMPSNAPNRQSSIPTSRQSPPNLRCSSLDTALL
jgi:hypothetical protein